MQSRPSDGPDLLAPIMRESPVRGSLCTFGLGFCAGVQPGRDNGLSLGELTSDGCEFCGLSPLETLGPIVWEIYTHECKKK